MRRDAFGVFQTRQSRNATAKSRAWPTHATQGVRSRDDQSVGPLVVLGAEEASPRVRPLDSVHGAHRHEQLHAAHAINSAESAKSVSFTFERLFFFGGGVGTKAPKPRAQPPIRIKKTKNEF